MTEQEYMRRAIELAKNGTGAVDPNPLVGAVIVKDGRIIGEGWHARYGDLHAERNALKNLTESAEDAEIYVTLEPCCHHGKQPPCTDAILESGISKVVIGSRDPNPLVAGKGAEILRKAGVEVVEDFLRDECDALNPVFFHYITTKTPYVIMKYAMTADGKIATKTGASKWITGSEARQAVQQLRIRCTGIMAGIGTVLADDPLLTVREEGKRSPVRIICDSRLRIPLDSQIVQTAKEYRTILACAPDRGRFSVAKELGDREPSPQAGDREPSPKVPALLAAGVELLSVPGPDGRVDLKKLMRFLGGMGINSILLEGGGGLNDSALRSGIVHEVHAFIAPKIFGSADAKSPVEGSGISEVAEAVPLTLYETAQIGEDILLKYRIRKEAV